MKKFLATLLTLTLLATFLFVVPVSAATTFVSNMAGWTGIRGTWDFTTGNVEEFTSNNYASPVETTVSKSDNWTWNVDVSTESTAPGFQFQFGRATAAYANVSMFYIQTSADAKARLYYNDGTTSTYYTGWKAFPEGSSANEFNVKIAMLNGKCYVYIDNTCLIIHDMSTTEYNGGYFGVFNSKFAANYNNINLYVNNDTISVTNGYYLPIENGFATPNATQKWNQAIIGKQSVGKFATVSMDYNYKSGNNQSYIKFGVTDINYYDLRLQPVSGAEGQIQLAIYQNPTGEKGKVVGSWVTVDSASGYDISAFNIKIVLSPTVAEVYIDNNPIMERAIDYDGGKFGIDTYCSAVEFKNISIDTAVDNSVDFIAGRLTTANSDGSITFADSGWGRSTVGVQSNKDFEISFDVKNGSGNQQYFLYFGTSSANYDTIADGYSVRLALSESVGKNNVIVYDEVTQKRVSPNWQPIPEGSDPQDFTLTVKYLNGITRVLIDGKHILITNKLAPAGLYTYFKTSKTSATISLSDYSVPETTVGDADANSKVTANDLALLRKTLLGAVTVIDEVAANCNSDDAINIIDIVRLKKILAGDISVIDGYTATAVENCAYSLNGAFKLYNAGKDFNSEMPYIYLDDAFSTESDLYSGFEAKLGVYMTSNYTVSETGFITADSNQTLNKDELVIGSETLNVETVSLEQAGDYNEYKLYISNLQANTSKTVRGYVKAIDSNGEAVYFYSGECCFFALTES